MVVESVFVMALAFVMSAFLGAVVGNEPAAELKVGDAAPEFRLPGSDGKTYELKTIRKDHPVVLAWYPKAFTGG